jgi:hypothetical protein
MLQVWNDSFSHDILVDVHKLAITLPWTLSNVANRKTFPQDSVLTTGSHRFFGVNTYSRYHRYNITNSTPQLYFDILDFIVYGLIKTDNLELISIDHNLQMEGQNGTAHKDLYLNNGGDRTILFYPHYEWKEENGGPLEILDENFNVVESILPNPGCVVYFDGSVNHRAIAPKIANIPRISTAFRMEYLGEIM